MTADTDTVMTDDADPQDPEESNEDKNEENMDDYTLSASLQGGEYFGTLCQEFIEKPSTILMEKILERFSSYYSSNRGSAMANTVSTDLASFFLHVIPVDFADFSPENLCNFSEDSLLRALFSFVIKVKSKHSSIIGKKN